MKNHQLINSDSGNVEYYTPSEIIEAARRTMGRIDLDPASSSTANLIVKAATFWTEKDGALNKEWSGRVWMNHPFHRRFNAKWIRKITQEAKKFNPIEGCCICFASTSEKWFRPLLDWPYRLEDGSIKKGATKGSVVTYFGENVDKFAAEFRNLGAIKITKH